MAGRRRIRTGRPGIRELRVFLVIAAGLGILLYLTIRVGQIFEAFVPRYEIVALFPTVTGLSSDATVSVAGRRVGRVERIELVPPEQRIGDRNVLVRLAINRDAMEHIRADSRARLRIFGLLGDRFVDIDPGSPDAPILRPKDTLPTIRPILFEEDFLEPTARVLARAHLVLDDLHRITGALTRAEGTLGRLLTDDALYRNLTGATQELTGFLAELNRADGTLARLLRDPDLYDQISATLARIDTLGAVALHGGGTLERLLRDDLLYDEMVLGLRQAGGILEELNELLSGLEAGEGTLGRLLRDPELYDQVLRLVIDLQILIQAIREDPGPFLPEIRVRLF